MVKARKLAEPAHPHGWIGYVVADRERTGNVLRLARWLVPAAVSMLAIVAAVLVVLVLVSPLAAAGLLASGSTATAGGLTVRRRRRRGQSTCGAQS